MTIPTQPAPTEAAEQIYFAGSPLLRGELARNGILLVLGVLIIAGSIVGAVMGFLPALAGIVVGLLLLCLPWLLTKTVHYRISSYRIDYERGLIGKKVDTLELWHVNDISFSQSPLERLMGVGTITVDSSDNSTPKLALHGLPNSRPLFDALKTRVIAVKRQRGVIKLDQG